MKRPGVKETEEYLHHLWYTEREGRFADTLPFKGGPGGVMSRVGRTKRGKSGKASGETIRPH